MKVFVTLMAFLLLASSAGADRELANIRVTPSTSFEPATVMLEVTVVRRNENRLLTVTLDSGSYYWSSQRALDREEGPYLSVFVCRSLPAGEYHVEASVVGDNGRVRAMATNRVVVISRGPGSDF